MQGVPAGKKYSLKSVGPVPSAILGADNASDKVQRFMNTLTYFILRQDHFPLPLSLVSLGKYTLSPIGEGKSRNRLEALLR